MINSQVSPESSRLILDHVELEFLQKVFCQSRDPRKVPNQDHYDSKITENENKQAQSCVEHASKQFV